MTKDVTQDRLDEIGIRDGDDYIIDGHRYHVNVIRKYDDGSPRRTLLLMCGIHTDCPEDKDGIPQCQTPQ